MGAGRRTSWPIVPILIAYMALAVWMSATVPFGSAPDERPHLDYIKYLVEHHKWPVLSSEAPTQFEFHQPPLYYLLCTPAYAAAGVIDRMAHDPAEGWVRMVSVVLGAMTVWAVYWALGEAFGKRWRLRVPIAACIAFLPMFVFLTASINNDDLVILLFAIALGMGARMAHRGPTLGLAFAMGIVAGLGGLTKVVGLLLIPIGIAACWIPVAGTRDRRRAAVIAMAILLAVSLALCGPWLARNQLVYGDPLGQKAFMQFFGPKNVKPGDFIQGGMSMGQYGWMVTRYSLMSLLGVYGHMNVWLPGWVYGMFGIVMLAGLVGICVWYVREAAGTPTPTRRALGLWSLAFLLVVLFFLKFNTEFFQAQARYMFPALIPIVAGIVLGVTRLVPARARPAVAWTIAAALFVVTICVIGEYGSLARHM